LIKLSKLTQNQTSTRKHLEMIRKQLKQHNATINDYKSKQKRPMLLTNQPSVTMPNQPQPLSRVPPPTSPMLMGPSGPSTPIGMGNPGTPVTAPQSPSIMSPSPMAPSPMAPSPIAPSLSPMMHSPASIHHSPSSMIQSPIYTQQSSPMSIHSLSMEPGNRNQSGQNVMQDDVNHFGDMFAKKERMPPVMHNNVQLRPQAQGSANPHNFENMPVPHQQGFPQMQQMRMPINSQNQPQPGNIYSQRPNDSVRYMAQHPNRPYSEMVVQPFSSHPMPNQQSFSPQQVVIRRMPPPPSYPNHFYSQQQQQRDDNENGELTIDLIFFTLPYFFFGQSFFIIYLPFLI